MTAGQSVSQSVSYLVSWLVGWFAGGRSFSLSVSRLAIPTQPGNPPSVDLYTCMSLPQHFKSLWEVSLSLTLKHGRSREHSHKAYKYSTEQIMLHAINAVTDRPQDYLKGRSCRVMPSLISHLASVDVKQNGPVRVMKIESEIWHNFIPVQVFPLLFLHCFRPLHCAKYFVFPMFIKSV